MVQPATRLLEREAPLAMLREARARAADRGCVALVSGEAGIGKTALVATFTGALDDAGLVAIGRCDALFTPRVLGPAYDIAAREGGALRRLLDASAPRPALFAAFLDLLRGRGAPVVVFEDVHWADEATLDLVKFLGRRIGETHALLVLTYRDDELSPRHPLRLVLGDLPRDRCVTVTLAPLSAAAVESLVEPAMAGTSATAGAQADAASLHRATGGNPFYVTEVLASGKGIPASVRDAVLARAARLGPDARAVADLASVAPGGLEPAIVDACVERASEGIAECEDLGVLRGVGDRLRFRHEIARLALAEALGASRARELNARVLEAIRARAGDEDLPRLAHHAEAAEDARRALEYSVAAARRAAVLNAHREAAGHYARAVRFAGSLPARERATLLEDYAWECHLTARGAEGVDAREAAIAIWRASGDVAREAAALGRQAMALIGMGRNSDGGAATRRSLALLDAIDDEATRATIYRFAAYVAMLERDSAEAVDYGTRALRIVQALGDREGELFALNTLGSALLVDDDERGYEHLERSLALARAADDAFHVAIAYVNLGSASGEVHRFGRAAGYLEEGIAHAERHDLDAARDYAQAWLALTQVFLGRWPEAAVNAQAVLGRADTTTIARIMALVATGRLRARRGDPGVWAALDEALALSENTRTLQRLAPVRAARAEAAWLEGEEGGAAREAAAAYELACSRRHAWFMGELAYAQWKAGRALDVPEGAASPYALQVAGRWRDAAGEWEARACPYEAARALAEGDVEARLEALRRYDALGARPAAERLRHALRAAGVRRVPRGVRASTRALPAGLTSREVQVLGLVAQNLTNAEIASRLHISPKTVEHHMGAVLAKLGVDSRREALRAAEAMGVNRGAMPAK